MELTLPASDAKWQNPPRPLNYPFNTTGWFEKNSERFNLDEYVNLHTEMWGYFPARLTRIINLAAMGSNEPMGKLSLGVQLNKLQQGKKLDLSNPRSLGDYIKWEYADYYETQEVGDNGKGRNYRYRKEYGQRLSEKGESYRDQYEAGLKNHLEPIPDHFDLLNFGGGLWTSFILEKLGHMSTQHYCIPLSESYLLKIHIRQMFDKSRERELIEPDMRSAAEWLVQHIKIMFPGKQTGPLALQR